VHRLAARRSASISATGPCTARSPARPTTSSCSDSRRRTTRSDLLLSPTYAPRLYDGLWVWTRFNLPRVTTLPAPVAVPRVVGGLALAGLAMAAADRLRARRSADRQPAAVVAWTLALAWPVGLYAMVAAYDGHGGHTHPRYLFPGLATLAAVGALGLDRLAGAGHGPWVVGVALAQLALTGAAWAGSSSSSVGLRMAWRRPG
jgi:hypothetical protein